MASCLTPWVEMKNPGHLITGSASWQSGSAMIPTRLLILQRRSSTNRSQPSTDENSPTSSLPRVVKTGRLGCEPGVAPDAAGSQRCAHDGGGTGFVALSVGGGE